MWLQTPFSLFDFSSHLCKHGGRQNSNTDMRNNSGWKEKLKQNLLQAKAPKDPRITPFVREKAARHIVRGAALLRRLKYPFIPQTRKRCFSMLDPEKDVLSGGGPESKARVRRSLCHWQYWQYGFGPRVFHDIGWWEVLYTFLWRRAGKFFARHTELGMR